MKKQYKILLVFLMLPILYLIIGYYGERNLNNSSLLFFNTSLEGEIDFLDFSSGIITLSLSNSNTAYSFSIDREINITNCLFENEAKVGDSIMKLNRSDIIILKKKNGGKEYIFDCFNPWERSIRFPFEYLRPPQPSESANQINAPVPSKSDSSLLGNSIIVDSITNEHQYNIETSAIGKLKFNFHSKLDKIDIYSGDTAELIKYSQLYSKLNIQEFSFLPHTDEYFLFFKGNSNLSYEYISIKFWYNNFDTSFINKYDSIAKKMTILLNKGSNIEFYNNIICYCSPR